jgi:hypothetical protein
MGTSCTSVTLPLKTISTTGVPGLGAAPGAAGPVGVNSFWSEHPGRTRAATANATADHNWMRPAFVIILLPPMEEGEK